MIPRTATKKTSSNHKGNPSQRKLVALVCSDGKPYGTEVLARSFSIAIEDLTRYDVMAVVDIFFNDRGDRMKESNISHSKLNNNK